MGRPLLWSAIYLFAFAFATVIACSETAQAAADEKLPLCGHVDTTLAQLETTLTRHGVPFTTSTQQQQQQPRTADSNATARSVHANRPAVLIDLSSIQDMMRAFGCPATATRNAVTHTTVTHTTKEHTTKEQTTRNPTPSPNATAESETIINPQLAHAQEHQQRRELLRLQTRSRERRASTPSQSGACTLASILSDTCAAGTDNITLTITFDGSEQINGTIDNFPLLRISANIATLILRGTVHEPQLQWVLDNGNWDACFFFILEGLQFDTFRLSTLHRFLSLRGVRLQRTAMLQAVDTHNFPQAGQIRRLDIHNTSLATIPSLANFTSLQVLDMYDNRIRHVSKDAFAGLTALSNLFMDGNLISRIDRGAFAEATALTELVLSDNDITAVPEGLLHPLMRLTVLKLQHNPMRELDPDVFGSLTSIRLLVLSSTLITSLPTGIFAAATRLTDLDLAHNLLTSLPETIFSGLSLLDEVQLFSNRLTSLPPQLFREQTALTRLSLDHNRIKYLPPSLFDTCSELRFVICSNNGLQTIPPRLFPNSPHMVRINFANNALRAVDGLFDGSALSALVALDLEGNRLTQLHIPTPLPSLRSLILSRNPVQHVPNTKMVPELGELRMQGHHIKRLDLTPLLSLQRIGTLDVSAAGHVHSTAMLDAAAVSVSPALHALSATNVDLSSVLGVLQQLPSLQLHELGVGWPGADETTLPVSLLCHVLADDVDVLRLPRVNHASIELCSDKRFDTVQLQGNGHLRSVNIPTTLKELNVSDCTQLTSITVPFVDILDISNTRVQLNAALCTRWGRRILFARNLDPVFVDLQYALSAMGTCLDNVDILDLSGNAWLDSPQEVNRVVSNDIALSDLLFITANFFTIRSRPTPPILQLQSSPVDCAIAVSNQELRRRTDTAIVSNEIVYSFHCTCARGYKMTSGGRCVVDNPDVAGIAAGSVIGGLALGLLMAWLSRRYRGLTKRIDLQEQLLVERDEEVMALKKAWEIEYDELRLVERVAAGAFGVVFKAEWDTVTVAVKVLQQAVMAFDESTVLEFEKEVEFLQRTRHPHVVRFFGAGTDPNGSPFLVLEFVALGSLKDLLGKDLEGVLREMEQHAGDDNHDVVLRASRDGADWVWALKTRLLRDIASGMAFIHSLDQVHRDLKSGNVLVNSKLRAKITDFGSIRQCLTRGRGGSVHAGNEAQRAGLLSSSDEAGDLQYSRQAGLTTQMNLTMTAGVGTPLYMAPEAIVGDKYNAKADVFSFGVLMWEVATQRVPDLIEQEKGSDFRGPLLPALAELLLEGKRLRFEDHDGVPEWFQTLTSKCVHEDPQRRPTFAELEAHHLNA